MFTKLALASAVAIPLGFVSLSGAALAEDDWNPNSSYNPSYDIPIYKSAAIHAKSAAIHARAPVIHHAGMSCAAARNIVREDGFHNVMARECGAGEYVFHATRNGRAMVLYVNPRNGRVSHT